MSNALEELKKQNKLKVRLELNTTLGQTRTMLRQAIERYLKTKHSVESWRLALKKKGISNIPKKDIRKIIKMLESDLADKAELRDQLIEAVNEAVERWNNR